MITFELNKNKNMKKLVLVLLVGFLAMGCSKDQKVVKNLAGGEWKITAQSVDGVSEPDSNFEGSSYMFEKCKVKKGDCPGTYTYIDEDKGSTTAAFTYSIFEDGTKITVNIEFALLGTIITSSSTGNIIENSSSKFIWSSTEDGEVTETTIEKI